MERNDAGSAGAMADLGGLDAALEQLEQSIARSAKKFEASLTRIAGTLETSFGSLEANLKRLETKLDLAGKALVAIAAQTKETENSLVLLMEGILQILDGNLITGGRKVFSAVYEPTEEQKKFWGFLRQDPYQLLNEFKNRQRQITTLQAGGEQVAAEGLVADIRHEQELILAALKSNANFIKSQIQGLEGIASNPGMSDKSPAIQNYEKSLQTIREVFDEIRKFATDPALRGLIDRSRPALDRSPRQTGALATSPGALQYAGLGADDADATGRSMQQLDESLSKTAVSYGRVTEEAGRFEALTGPLVTGLAETNSQFVSQADRLRGLGVLLPDIARQLVDVFDSGTLGAERLDSAVRAVGDRFLDAFEGAIRRGESLGDVLKSLGRDLANLALNEVKTKGIGGIFDILGGLFTSTVLPAAGSQSGPHKGAKGLVFTNARLASFARGNAFDMGARLDRFARGGAFTNTIVNRPTLFPMASGAGLMGEAGPEAVMPLTRLANGDLGVRSLPGAAPQDEVKRAA